MTEVEIVSDDELEAMWLQELEMVKREAHKAGKPVHCSADLEFFFNSHNEVNKNLLID